MDSPRDLLQVRDRRVKVRRDARELVAEIARAGRETRFGGAHRKPEGDQSLLGAVVEIALDPVKPASRASASSANG